MGLILPLVQRPPGSQHYGLVMFLVVRTPRKAIGPVSRRIGGHKRTTEEAGIALSVSAFDVSAVSN